MFFQKTRIFFKKLKHFLVVESTAIESVAFPYKAALSEANVKTNRIGSTKWTYHKEYRFTSSYLVFMKTSFQYKS